MGGQYIYRPDRWTLTSKAAYVQNESEGELSAESFDALFKAERTLGPRLSAFGRYGFLHDRFAGIVGRNIVEGGLSYLLVNEAPQTLNVDASFGYAHESRVDTPDLSDPLLAVGAVYRPEAFRGRRYQRRRAVQRGGVGRRQRLAVRQHRVGELQAR